MPEVLPIIPAGSSAEWQLKIKNADLTPVDPSVTDGYAIFLFDAKGKVVKKYSNAAHPGFIGTLSLEGTDIKMLWEASQTKDFPNGEIWWQYMQQTDNPEYVTDTMFTAKTLKKRLCVMEDTESKFTADIT